MILLLSSLWPQLAAAVALGLAIGGSTGFPRERMAVAGAGALFACLAVVSGVALLRTTPGEAGLWVEIAALLLGAYLAGCGLGSSARAAFRRAG